MRTLRCWAESVCHSRAADRGQAMAGVPAVGLEAVAPRAAALGLQHCAGGEGARCRLGMRSVDCLRGQAQRVEKGWRDAVFALLASRRAVGCAPIVAAPCTRGFYVEFRIEVLKREKINFAGRCEIGRQGHGPRPQVSTMAVKQKRKTNNDFSVREFEEDEEDEADSEGILDMQEWFQNRPTGFGHDKVYDLSLEDKLLQEIECQQKAQSALTQSQKGAKGKADGKKSGKTTKVSEKGPLPAGVEVWVGNLPRKRNIDRDLRAAFKTVQGLLHVRPIIAVESEKTREPLCKGFAFLTFATDDAAARFVKRFHGESISFGKVEKKLACQVAVSESPWKPESNNQRPAGTATGVPKLRVRDKSGAVSTSTPPADPVTTSVQSADLALESGMEAVKGLTLTLDAVPDSDLSELSSVEDETELRALEEDIWQDLEDEDDDLLDLELERDGRGEPARSVVESLEASDLSEISGSENTSHGSLALDTETSGVSEVDRLSPSRPSEEEGQRHVSVAALATEIGDNPEINRLSSPTVGESTAATEQVEEDSSEGSDSDESIDDFDDESVDTGDKNLITAMSVASIGDAGSISQVSHALSTASGEVTKTNDKSEKRIKELELRVREMERELKEKEALIEKVAAAEAERITILERRVLGKARVAMGVQEEKVKSGKASMGQKKVRTAVSKIRSAKPNTGSLGAANRLKKKERKIYTEVMSKYVADPA